MSPEHAEDEALGSSADLLLQVHALEWKVKDLAHRNQELSDALRVATDTLGVVYRSRGWRLLEALRGR